MLDFRYVFRIFTYIKKKIEKTPLSLVCANSFQFLSIYLNLIKYLKTTSTSRVEQKSEILLLYVLLIQFNLDRRGTMSGAWEKRLLFLDYLLLALSCSVHIQLNKLINGTWSNCVTHTHENWQLCLFCFFWMPSSSSYLSL